jgi:adenylate kinase
MLRAAVRDGTPLGLEAKAVMARGDLVSDDLIIAMFKERLGADDTSTGVLLDGFPRTEAQAGALDDMLVGLDRSIAAVIVFDIDEETVVRRLSGRRMCRANDHVYHVESNPPAVEGVCDIDGSELYQRDDDQPDVIRTRFRKQWVEAAAPVIEYYRGRGLVSNLDAARSREQVSAELDELLDGLGARA